jgi:hypothetical protein
MKKITIILASLLFLMIPFSGNADNIWMKSLTVTSSGLIATGPGYYYGIKVNTDGTNSATVVVYDNTAASGTVIDPSTVYATSASQKTASIQFNTPLLFNNGLYVSITCSGTTSVTIYYVQK